MLALSMNLIGQSSTKLWNVLAVDHMRSCDLDLWPTFSKIRSRDREH